MTTAYAPYESATASDVMVDQLKKSPFFLISMLIHAFVLFIMSLVGTNPPQEEVVKPIVSTAEAPVELPDPEVPPVDEETEPVDPEEVVTPDPDPREVEVSDHPETDTDEPYEETAGEEDASADTPFDSKSTLNTVGLGSTAGSRWGRGRGGRKNLKKEGGGGRTEITVDSGLAWLKNHQSADGGWSSDNFMNEGVGVDRSKPLCDGKGIAMYDVGVSGLSLLAFLGAGHTHREGAHRDTVRKGLKWLQKQQDSEGCFGQRGDGHFSYNHACGALAMTEAYGMTRSPAWKNAAQQGINFVQAMRNPYKGWRYGVRPGDNDISVTGWMVMALKSAKMAGLELNTGIFPEVLSLVEEKTDEGTGRTGYQRKGEPPVRAEGRLEKYPSSESESITAVAMLTRVFCGQNPKSSEALKQGADLLLKKLPVWDSSNVGKLDMYYWYYGTLAMFQMGGSPWTSWNNRMKSAVIDSQRDDGNFKGSWDPIGPWGEDGGRVYSTALMTMCLEVYYRYGRVFGTR